MDREFKHGPELREFWRVQKARYRRKKKAVVPKVRRPDTTAPKLNSRRGEPKDG